MDVAISRRRVAVAILAVLGWAAAAHAEDALQPALARAAPTVDGLEATRRIKEQWPETKILVLTSLTEDNLREAAYGSGADGFLNKRDIASRLLLAIRAVTSALRV